MTTRINRIREVYRRYEDIIEQAARLTGLDPWLIATVIYHESGGNPRAVSPKGARGLMQIMPGTAAGYGYTNPDLLYQPELNIMLGARYLSGQLKRFGDLKLALAAYNAGPGRVQKYRGIPPFRETQNYVASIMRHYELVRGEPSQFSNPPELDLLDRIAPSKPVETVRPAVRRPPRLDLPPGLLPSPEISGNSGLALVPPVPPAPVVPLLAQVRPPLPHEIDADSIPFGTPRSAQR